MTQEQAELAQTGTALREFKSRSANLQGLLEFETGLDDLERLLAKSDNQAVVSACTQLQLTYKEFILVHAKQLANTRVLISRDHEALLAHYCFCKYSSNPPPI